MDKLFDMWANRTPEWETKYEKQILKTFCDYGRGTTAYQEARGKIFGAGYEILILAYFIGLYNNGRKPLVADTSKRKTLGQPIKFWGNLDSKPGRKAYPSIRRYIFASLIARSNVNLLDLDKGLILPKKIVDILMDTMEEYINWGLGFISEKLEDNPNYFFKETAFLRIFLDLGPQEDTSSNNGNDEPESLD